MVRLINPLTGMVVHVREGKVVPGYVPADESKKVEAPKRAPAVRKSTK